VNGHAHFDVVERWLAKSLGEIAASLVGLGDERSDAITRRGRVPEFDPPFVVAAETHGDGRLLDVVEAAGDCVRPEGWTTAERHHCRDHPRQAMAHDPHPP
jgi:hypothetical protein